MTIIGLTGSFASGKTEAAKIFERLGAEVFDADKTAKGVIERGKPTYNALVKLFGEEYLKKDGSVDRKKLAGHVFTHPADLKKLNILTHPAVIFECLKFIRKFRQRKGMGVLDIPLLFESKMQGLADVTVVVKAAPKTILSRCEKKGISRDRARNILASQWPVEKKARLADFVIRNDGSLEQLENEVKKILQLIKKGER